MPQARALAATAPVPPIKELDSISHGALENVQPLADSDITAIREFHARGLLDFLIVGDVSTGAELKIVHDLLLSIGATETKLIVKLKVCVVRAAF